MSPSGLASLGSHLQRLERERQQRGFAQWQVASWPHARPQSCSHQRLGHAGRGGVCTPSPDWLSKPLVSIGPNPARSNPISYSLRRPRP